MQTKGHRLSNEMLGIETPKRVVLPTLDYEAIITRQQQVIQQLLHEIKCLRQYLHYCVAQKEDESENETDCSLKNGESVQSVPKSVKTGNGQGGLLKLVKQIMKMVEVESIDLLLAKMKTVMERANRKIEPVFVERIKYKEVPVPFEIIKEVQKQVVVFQEKIVEVPIFRQKIVERFVERPAQTGSTVSCHHSEDREKQKQREKEEKEQDFGKKKLNFVDSPKHNQTYTIKSPRYKEKQEPDKQGGYMKSPKYRAKDSY